MFTFNKKKKEIKSAINRLAWLYLDTKYELWHWHIDLDLLDITWAEHCIGGQLESRYDIFTKKLRKHTLNEQFISYAIAPPIEYADYANRQWKKQVKSRRRKDKIGIFKDKLVSLFKRR